jgi:hypothetical protein
MAYLSVWQPTMVTSGLVATGYGVIGKVFRWLFIIEEVEPMDNFALYLNLSWEQRPRLNRTAKFSTVCLLSQSFSNCFTVAKIEQLLSDTTT